MFGHAEAEEVDVPYCLPKLSSRSSLHDQLMDQIPVISQLLEVIRAVDVHQNQLRTRA